MMIGSKAITRLSEPDGALVLNISKFPGGPLSCLDRIPPETQGVYSWFRNFLYSNDPAILFKQLVNDIERIKFAERSGAVKPYYEVSVKSKSWISATKKQRIERALLNDSFRNRLLETFGQSILFQTPLYIGKSSNLRRRIEQHLQEGSLLRTRLQESQININETLVLLIPTKEENSGVILNQIDNSDDADVCDDFEETLNEEDGLMEDILSRLFCPQFSLRLG